MTNSCPSLSHPSPFAVPFILFHLVLTTVLQSAFSQRLSQHSINFYDIFAPDLMHEFELGVWKALFAHLIRILHTQGYAAVVELNRR